MSDLDKPTSSASAGYSGGRCKTCNLQKSSLTSDGVCLQCGIKWLTTQVERYRSEWSDCKALLEYKDRTISSLNDQLSRVKAELNGEFEFTRKGLQSIIDARNAQLIEAEREEEATEARMRHLGIVLEATRSALEDIKNLSSLASWGLGKRVHDRAVQALTALEWPSIVDEQQAPVPTLAEALEKAIQSGEQSAKELAAVLNEPPASWVAKGENLKVKQVFVDHGRPGGDETAVVETVPAGSTYWLLERKLCGAPLWWSALQGWVGSTELATRYFSKETAEAALKGYRSIHHVNQRNDQFPPTFEVTATEHMDLTVTTVKIFPVARIEWPAVEGKPSDGQSADNSKPPK